MSHLNKANKARWIGWWCFFAVLLLNGPANSEIGPNDKRSHIIQPDDYFSIAQISNCILSPDGRFVVAILLILISVASWLAAQPWPVANEFQVNTYTTLSQTQSQVTLDDSGRFVVVWMSADAWNYGIFGQRYDNAGNAVGGEFQVNTYTTSEQWRPDVAADADGDFVVVWQSGDQDGSSWGVFAQRFDSAGQLVQSIPTFAYFVGDVQVDLQGGLWAAFLHDYLIVNYDNLGNPVSSHSLYAPRGLAVIGVDGPEPSATRHTARTGGASRWPGGRSRCSEGGSAIAIDGRLHRPHGPGDPRGVGLGRA